MKLNKDEILASLASSVSKLNESIAADFSSYGIVDPRDYGLFDQPGFYPTASAQSLGWLNRQRRGEYIPAFLNESQLSWLRRRVRMLAVNNEIAINAVNLHCAYVVGEGFQYEVCGRFDAPSPYENHVQAVVDAFVEHNELALKESEILSRMLIDGECFVRLFQTPSGVLAMRFIEPEFVRSPNGDSSQDSFGVRHCENDLENVEGYWIDETGKGSALTFVPAKEIVHFKWPETPTNSKRGFSAFYPIETTLRFVEDLLHSTVAMAKARAKIAWIRKLQNITADVAQALVTSQANVTGTDQQTQEDINMEKYRYGSILTTNADIEMPSANIAATDHVGVMQMVLRIVAARFSMPEYMLSSDASNANYASTMVAESPFVKTMQRIQDVMARLLGRNRYLSPRQSLVWRQIYHAADLELLPREAIASVKLQVTGPTLTIRDAAKDAQVDKIYFDMGIKSKTTIQLEQGLDPDEETANLKKEGPPPGSPPPGEGVPSSKNAPPMGDQKMESADWDEDKHPRDKDDGRFAPKNTGGSGDKSNNKKDKKNKKDNKDTDDPSKDWYTNRTGPSKPEERDHEKPLPIKEMVPPPPPQKRNVAPKNAKGKPSTGYAANGMKATWFGDLTEELTAQLGMRSILPEGKRTNKDVDVEGSSIDVEFDHTGYAFEIKGVCIEATKYKAGPKQKEVDDKHNFARMHNLKPCMMIVVMDFDNGVGYAYWQEGITTSHKINPKNMKGWNYAGKIKYKPTSGAEQNEIWSKKKSEKK